MIDITIIDIKIDALRSEIEKEDRSIAAAIAAKHIGDGSGHWKRLHDLRSKLRIVSAIRDAVAEAQP